MILAPETAGKQAGLARDDAPLPLGLGWELDQKAGQLGNDPYGPPLRQDEDWPQQDRPAIGNDPRLAPHRGGPGTGLAPDIKADGGQRQGHQNRQGPGFLSKIGDKPAKHHDGQHQPDHIGTMRDRTGDRKSVV